MLLGEKKKQRQREIEVIICSAEIVHVYVRVHVYSYTYFSMSFHRPFMNSGKQTSYTAVHVLTDQKLCGVPFMVNTVLGREYPVLPVIKFIQNCTL